MEKMNLVIISIVAIVAIVALAMLIAQNNLQNKTGYVFMPIKSSGIGSADEQASAGKYTWTCDCTSWLSIECRAPMTCNGCCKQAYDELWN